MFYYSGKSVFSRWPETVKITLLFVFIFLSIVFTTPLQELFLFAVIFALLFSSGFRGIAKLFLGLLPFLALADIGFLLVLSSTSIDVANLIVVSNLRIFNLFMASAFFSYSTDAFAIVRLMRRLYFPELIYLPVFALFRFLPEIERDFKEIRDIQKTRGISKKQPLKYVKSILVPLFITVLEKSDELAIAYYLRKKREQSIAVFV
ncbi:MAG: energy-coupling factor transporter transmembrane protein EcfT [Candidatus Diapherotrites archaeon]|nr:energy-coupling factor transporter transmembrane protein EcfT [Candidatus Diapherotrites archaeon]